MESPDVNVYDDTALVHRALTGLKHSAQWHRSIPLHTAVGAMFGINESQAISVCNFHQFDPYGRVEI